MSYIHLSSHSMPVIVETATRLLASPAGLAEVHATLLRFFAATDPRARVREPDRRAIVAATAEIAASFIQACPDAEIALTMARRPHSVEVQIEDRGPARRVSSPRFTVAGMQVVECCLDGAVNRWHLVRETGLGPSDDGP
jgi:hypothetical protein